MTPVEVTWIAGDDHGLVWPDGLALVDGDLELSVAEQLWSVMSDGSDLAGFLEGLSTACGGLLAIPGFAIGLRLSDGVHFAVRGDFRVHATDAAGEPLDISGGEAVTWSERLVPGTVAFMLSGPADAEGVARRLANGVVPASRLTSGLRTGQDAEGARDDLVESPETSEPVGRALEDEGLVVGFPGNEDLGATAAPNDLDVTRLPEDDLVTLLPGELDVDGPIPGAFDDLWDATIARSVEEAAVRNAGEEHTSAGVPNRPSGPGAPSPGTPATAGPTPGTGSGADPWWRNADGLISGVPVGPGVGGAGPWPQPARHGDHAGETIGRLDLEGLVPGISDRRAVGHPGPGGGASVAPDPTAVPAVFCSRAHPNPPQSTACRICREAIPPDVGRRVAQPVVGRMRASTGATCELIGIVLVGRKPSGARGHGADLPQLLVIPGYPHVSSNHLEIRVDGWTVFARDLGSLNGTFLRRRGEQPSKLTEPIPIYNGDILDLGHGASVVFEEMP